MNELEYLPDDPVIRGFCAWCGDELYAGEQAFRGDEGCIHAECLLPMLEEHLGAEYLAGQCGYEEVVL